MYAAADWSGRFLDLAKMASAAQIPRQSAVRFFEILEDCLLVRRADPFGRSPVRRLVQHPKFYFFDGGVLNGLQGNFLTTYRTEHGAEVDLILERGSETWALEVKAARAVRSEDLGGLRSFREFHGRRHRSWVLYLGEDRRVVNGVEIWPWQEGLRAIFGAP